MPKWHDTSYLGRIHIVVSDILDWEPGLILFHGLGSSRTTRFIFQRLYKGFSFCQIQYVLLCGFSHVPLMSPPDGTATAIIYKHVNKQILNECIEMFQVSVVLQAYIIISRLSSAGTRRSRFQAENVKILTLHTFERFAFSAVWIWLAANFALPCIIFDPLDRQSLRLCTLTPSHLGAE